MAMKDRNEELIGSAPGKDFGNWWGDPEQGKDGKIESKVNSTYLPFSFWNSRGQPLPGKDASPRWKFFSWKLSNHGAVLMCGLMGWFFSDGILIGGFIIFWFIPWEDVDSFYIDGIWGSVCIVTKPLFISYWDNSQVRTQTLHKGWISRFKVEFLPLQLLNLEIFEGYNNTQWRWPWRRRLSLDRQMCS